MSNRRVLIRVTSNLLRDALGLRADLSVDDVWRYETDRASNCYTITISGDSLPELAEGAHAAYVDAESLKP